jgi:hypothetical protein
MSIVWKSIMIYMDETTPQVKKPIVYTENPFSYNYVALKQSKVNEIPLPDVGTVITDPVCHAVGKSLGVDKAHDWNKYYDKVFLISSWAKERSEIKDPMSIVKWISDKIKSTPSLGAKVIDDLYINIRLGGEHEQ